jgi:hypothetical protein
MAIRIGVIALVALAITGLWLALEFGRDIGEQRAHQNRKPIDIDAMWHDRGCRGLQRASCSGGARRRGRV